MAAGTWISIASGVREGDHVNLPSGSLLRVAVTQRSTDAACVGARSGERVGISYEGRRFKDSKIIDASKERGDELFEFTLGSGQVIKGLDDGLLGMCVGEGRRLVIPSDLGYGSRGAVGVASGDTLVFDVIRVT